MIDQCRFRQSARVMNFYTITFFIIYFVGYVRYCRDHIHIEFTVQAFLDNLHMQQSQESATETKTQSGRTFRLECQGSIIQLQFLQ